MFHMGPMELGIIAAIVLLIFGPKQLPKMGRSIGQTIKEFRGVAKELQGSEEDEE
mgnify:FL=1